MKKYREAKMVTPNYSYSLLSSWRRCRQRFVWQYLEGYRAPSSIGQVKGTAGHAALANWHLEYNAEQSLKVADETFQAALVNNGLPNDESSQDAWEDLEEALLRYYPYSEMHDTFTLINSELEFNIDVGGENFKGYIDAVIEDTHGYTWLMEHKFNKRVYTKHLDLDAQVGLYMLAASLLGYQPQGVMYNIIRTGGGPTARKDPVVRKTLYRNPEGLHYIATELQAQIADIQTFLQEGGYVYRNPTKDCSWDCPFYRACLSLEDVGEASSVLKHTHRGG